ncbi:MAG: PLP-dependent aminotransferase family protein [Pseudomonadota bacterium]
MTFWQPVLEERNLPRYIALADAIEAAIHSGELSHGERLPTHRKLADLLGVTVGTVTRGYAEAERRGMVHAVVGSGTYAGPAETQSVTFAHLAPQPAGDDEIDFSLNLPVGNRPSPVLEKVLPGFELKHHVHRELLEYHAEQGLPRHRQWALKWLNQFGVRAEMENLTITCGAQHGIYLAMQAAARAGETVAAEGLSYPGINAVASQLGVKAVGVPLDDEGVVPEAFDSLCRQNNLRALYCCPTIHNPTNASMSLQRRQHIVELAREHNVWIIEDEVPSVFHTQPIAPLHQLDPEITLYINSHSKLVAPGLRVGYLVSPPRLTESVADALRAQCWFGPTLPTEIAQRWLDTEAAAQWHEWQKNELSTRVDLAQQSLGKFGLRSRQNSFHCWLPLPEPWRASDFKDRLHHKKVNVLTAESFATGHFSAPQGIRICISAPSSVDEVASGLAIIRTELERHYEAKLSVF